MHSHDKILIVDDEPVNRLTLELFLTRSGWRVASAIDGLAALNLLASDESWKWILLDLNMPRLDGYGVLKAINEKLGLASGRFKIVILSATSEEEFFTYASTQGIDTSMVIYFMRKPVDLAVLTQVLTRISD